MFSFFTGPYVATQAGGKRIKENGGRHHQKSEDCQTHIKGFWKWWVQFIFGIVFQNLLHNISKLVNVKDWLEVTLMKKQHDSWYILQS